MSSGQSTRLLPLIVHALAKPNSLPASELLVGLRTVGANGHSVFLRKGRSYALQSYSTPDTPTKELEPKLRKLAPIIQLQQDLKHESELHESIPHTRLLKMILNRGAARDEMEAQHVSEALQAAGVVVTFHSNTHVHLRPWDLLPDFPSVTDVEAKLDSLNKQLEPLDKVHKHADQLTMGLLLLGYLVLAGQLGAFYYCIYGELSWDVMEPIAYLISLAYALLGYTYFLFTRGHVFDLQPFRDSALAYFKGRKYKKLSQAVLDEEQYQRLLKVRTHYLKRLETARRLEGSGSNTSGSSNGTVAQRS